MARSQEDLSCCCQLLGDLLTLPPSLAAGTWRGSVVAVKAIVLPAALSGKAKRERMAVMEAAISSTMAHPNIVQTYTYDMRP